MSTLTNEKIRSLFNDNFQLTMYAIDVARKYLQIGREFHLSSLLETLKKNPSILEELNVIEEQKSEEPKGDDKR